MNSLPLVNVFEYPCELWEYRRKTLEEIKQSGCAHGVVKEKLLACLTNHVDAGKYMLSVTVLDNQLENFINNYLNNSLDYKKMRQEMPSQTPTSLSKYQRQYQSKDFEQVSIDINNFFGGGVK